MGRCSWASPANVVLHFGGPPPWLADILHPHVRLEPRQKAGVLQGLIVICTAPFGLMIGSALSEMAHQEGLRRCQHARHADRHCRRYNRAQILLTPLMPTPRARP